MRRRNSAILIAIAALGLMLTGCSGRSAELPSISSATPSAAVDVEAIARDYLACMTAAGVPMQIQPDSHGKQTRVVPDGYLWWFVVRPPRGESFGEIKKNAPEDQKAMNDAAFARQQPGMTIDGQEHSGQYLTCLAQTGYEDRPASDESDGLGSTDPAAIQKQVESNNQWAQCARENGFPEIADTGASGTVAGWPTVLIPYTMVPAQLRELLSHCPNFNPESQDALNKWMSSATSGASQSPPPDVTPNPVIALDRTDLEGLSQTDIDRMHQLYDVLAEQQEAYHNGER